MEGKGAVIMTHTEIDELREKLIVEIKNEGTHDIENQHKKNTSVNQIHKFINKLKNANYTDLEKIDFKSLQDDIKNLSVSKYLSEILHYIFNLAYHVSKYSHIFLLIDIIKCISKNYDNASQLIDNIIFKKFFKLDDEDKNYFFIILFDLLNHLNEKQITSKDSFPLGIVELDKGRTQEEDFFLNVKEKHNAEERIRNSNQDKEDEVKIGVDDDLVKSLKMIKAMKIELTQKMECYQGNEKPNTNQNSDFFGFEVFTDESSVHFKRGKTVDKRLYMKEMLMDNQLLKKMEKRNKIRRVLVCLYYELIMLEICKDKNMLLFMFLNLTYFLTLKLDMKINNENHVPEVEKKQGEVDDIQDIIHEIKKTQLVNTVHAFNFFLMNVSSFAFSENMNWCEPVEGEEEEEEEDDEDKVVSNSNNILLKKQLLQMNSIHKHIKHIVQTFYRISMYNLLIFLYIDHVVKEYSSSDNKNNSHEEYDFFKLFKKSELISCILQIEHYSLEDIQIRGIEILGLNEESIVHIKAFDHVKHNVGNKEEAEEEMKFGDENNVWDNEEEKQFYTSFPDYSYININLQEEEEDEEEEEPLNVENENTADTICTLVVEPLEKDKETIKKDNKIENKGGNNDIKSTKSTPKTNKEKSKEFNTYLNNILKMSNEKDLEQHVMIFLLNYNTKKRRKMITNTLFHINKLILHCIPYYCKYIAIINKYVKEMSIPIIEELKSFTEKLIKDKTPININKKIKCIRYLSELSKFKLIDLSYILDILHLLIEHFTSDNAELSYYILDNCAIMLLNNSKTHIRFLNMLKRFKKIKSSKHLNAEMETMFEDCYIKINNYITNHSGALSNSFLKKKISKYSEDDRKKKYFLKKLLFEDIKYKDPEVICRYLRKFDWNTKLIHHSLKKYVFHYLMYMNFYEIHFLASLLFYIAKYKPFFVIQIIDEIYERIIYILENDDYEKFPYLIQYVELFSELYIYKILSSNNVFDLLYFLISLSDLDLHNSHHIHSVSNIFIENLEFANTIQKQIINSNVSNGPGSSECNKKTEENEKEEENVNPVFSYNNLNEEFTKYFFINKRNPIFFHMIKAGDRCSFIPVRLICMIVQKCSKFFHKPGLNLKFQRFLFLFKRFLLLLGPLPIEIDTMAQSLIRTNAKELDILESIKQVDSYLFPILNMEYEQHQRRMKVKEGRTEISESEILKPLQELKKEYDNWLEEEVKKHNQTWKNEMFLHSTLNDVSIEEEGEEQEVEESGEEEEDDDDEEESVEEDEDDDEEAYDDEEDEEKKIKVMNKEEMDYEINQIINESIQENRVYLKKKIKSSIYKNVNEQTKNVDTVKKTSSESKKIAMILKRKEDDTNNKAKKNQKNGKTVKDNIPNMDSNNNNNNNNSKTKQSVDKKKTALHAGEETKNKDFLKSFVLNSVQNTMEEDRKKEEIKLKKMFYKNSLKYGTYKEENEDEY